jgi:hypothetical protein
LDLAGTLLLALLVIVALLFTPLLLSFVEDTLFGSSRVEDFFKKVHLHAALSAIYNPVFDAVRWLLRRLRP